MDLAGFGVALLDWADQQVARTIAAVTESDLLIVASPTYKATYPGILKLFLDRISAGALAGVTALPLMLGGDWRHSLAADMLLKPVLVELGATCPTRTVSHRDGLRRVRGTRHLAGAVPAAAQIQPAMTIRTLMLRPP